MRLTPQTHAGTWRRPPVAVTLALLVLGAILGLAAGASSEAGAAKAAAPTNTSPPTISGDARVGQTLSATSGSWSGDTPMTFTFQWRRCDTAGANCTDITGATGQTYTLASDDLDKTIRVQVTATNADGSATALSAQTAVVAAQSTAPANTARPTVSGTLRDGQTLTASNGNWSGTTPMTFADKWKRCNPDLTPCVETNVTTQTYKLVAEDVGKRMLVTVTATNSAGSASADSQPTDLVAAAGSSPANSALPAISGTAEVGKTLTASNGTWTNSPTSFAYQWQRCNAQGSGCVSISGATKSTYVAASADVGSRLRVVVTAANAFGTNAATSQPTAAVGSGQPTGAIRLPNGATSIPASSVSMPDRLVIDKVSFSPSLVRSRNTIITVKLRVVDTRGYVVREALVFFRSTPIVTTMPPEQRTAQDGTLTFTIRPQADFPLKRGYAVQFFVRARKPGDNLLAGVSTRRLVQVRTARPS